jgi:dTDP-4-dehydrorhamnose 3,5-epimerase
MPLTVKETELPGVLMIESGMYSDSRGFCKDIYQLDEYLSSGLDMIFVQDNHSHSVKNVLRGIYYQAKDPLGKLVMAVTGEIYDVAVDIRVGSPYFGKWTGIYLSPYNNRQLYIPEGFAHGFCVLSDSADVIYKCTRYYKAGDDYGILWSDPDLDIDWPVKDPIISEGDRRSPKLADIPPSDLPVY